MKIASLAWQSRKIIYPVIVVFIDECTGARVPLSAVDAGEPRPIDPDQSLTPWRGLRPAAMETFTIETDGMGGFQIRVTTEEGSEGHVAANFPTYRQAREWIERRPRVRDEQD